MKRASRSGSSSSERHAIDSLGSRFSSFQFNICSSATLIKHRITESIKAFKCTYDIDHNNVNCAFAFVVSIILGLQYNNALIDKSAYMGLERRFEYIKQLNGAKIYLDYAHHPSEIEKNILSAKAITSGKLYVVFEPHTYSRTKALLNEFIGCFSHSDVLILLPTFPARENIDMGIISYELFLKIQIPEEKYFYLTYQKVKEYLNNSIRENDTVLILGAGNVDTLAKNL